MRGLVDVDALSVPPKVGRSGKGDGANGMHRGAERLAVQGVQPLQDRRGSGGQGELDGTGDRPGVPVDSIAVAGLWAELMDVLGYRRFGAAGATSAVT